MSENTVIEGKFSCFSQLTADGSKLNNHGLYVMRGVS